MVNDVHDCCKGKCSALQRPLQPQMSSSEEEDIASRLHELTLLLFLLLLFPLLPLALLPPVPS